MLNTNTLYVIETDLDVTYGWSPDGEGMCWYDTEEEARGQIVYNELTMTEHFDSWREWSKFRNWDD